MKKKIKDSIEIIKEEDPVLGEKLTKFNEKQLSLTELSKTPLNIYWTQTKS